MPDLRPGGATNNTHRCAGRSVRLIHLVRRLIGRRKLAIGTTHAQLGADGHRIVSQRRIITHLGDIHARLVRVGRGVSRLCLAG